VSFRNIRVNQNRICMKFQSGQPRRPPGARAHLQEFKRAIWTAPIRRATPMQLSSAY